jgi:hypothetical protein
MRTIVFRRYRYCIARLVIGALLFAQAALAVAACDWPRASPAQAFAANPDKPTCHEEPAPNANACLAHCLSGDQKSDVPTVPLPVLHSSLVLVISMPATRSAEPEYSRHALSRPPAPPPRILFQSFLI